MWAHKLKQVFYLAYPAREPPPHPANPKICDNSTAIIRNKIYDEPTALLSVTPPKKRTNLRQSSIPGHSYCVILSLNNYNNKKHRWYNLATTCSIIPTARSCSKAAQSSKRRQRERFESFVVDKSRAP